MPISTAPPVADKTPWHPSCVHQFLRATLPSLRVQPRHLLPAGMEITSYNHHAKAPSSLGALVLKPRLPGRSSLRSYPINFSRPLREVGSFTTTTATKGQSPHLPQLTEVRLMVRLAVCTASASV